MTKKKRLETRVRSELTGRLPLHNRYKKVRKVRPRKKSETVLTPGEIETLKAFAQLAEWKLMPGEYPSVREVSRALGMSEQGAQKHIRSLVTKGALEEVKQLKVVGRAVTTIGRAWLKVPS